MAKYVLTTVTGLEPTVTTHTVDAGYRMTVVGLPNGVDSAYTYDDADRLTDIEHVLDMDTLSSANSHVVASEQCQTTPVRWWCLRTEQGLDFGQHRDLALQPLISISQDNKL